VGKIRCALGIVPDVISNAGPIRSGAELACGIWVVTGTASAVSRLAELAQQSFACRAGLTGHFVAQHNRSLTPAARAI
jgi:hypothetical protein